MSTIKFIKHTSLAILLGFTFLIGYVVFHLGIWKEVAITKTEAPSLVVVFKKHEGAYHKIGDKISEVESYVKSLGFECKYSFGQYFDSPDSVEEARLRSRGGCLFIKDQKFELLSDIENFNSEKFKELSAGIEVEEINLGQVALARFMGSPSIGPYKVYPKVEEYIRSNNLVNNGPIIEVYLIKSPREVETTYLFPVKGK